MTKVCIIGAGGAGICLALELARKGVASVLVTGGGWREERKHRELYQGSVRPEGSHEPLENSRVRAHGGSTVRWGGRCIPYDPIDFEERGFLDFNGWPFTMQELEGYEEEAARYCVIEGAQFDYPASEFFPPEFEKEITVTKVERWSPPVNFATYYKEELESNELIEVLVDWHLVDLVPEAGTARLKHAVVRDWEGQSREIAADSFVIAAGGLETPRILLNLKERHDGAFAHLSPQIGKNYMGHLMGQHGTLEFKNREAIRLFDFMREGQAYVRRRFWLRPEAQRREGILNVIAFPFRPPHGDPAHRDPALSLLYLFKNRQEAFRAGGELMGHLRNIVFGGPGRLANAVSQIVKRFGPWKTRLPFILPTRYESKMALWVQSEHAPHQHSKVELGEERDHFGWKRLCVSVGFGDKDRETLRVFYRLLQKQLRDAGVGDLHYDEEGLDRFIDERIRDYSSGNHHIGTAKMGASPEEGVVDRNCLVHGLDNLYLCGSATFPTSSHANPTFVVIMMAMRLAEHLEAREKA